MKKLLSLIFTLTALASMLTVFSIQTAAADKDTLTITCRGEVLAEVEVGNEFIYHVGLNSGGYSPQAGQGEVRYDSDYVKVVEYGTLRQNGTVNMDAYSFPKAILNSNLITNYTERKDEILYDFSKYSGIGVFSDVNDHYFKVRFQAVAPGTVEVRHYLSALYTTANNQYLRLIYYDMGNKQLDPIPYTVNSVEPAVGYIGDADGDYNVTVMDATFIQHVTAGENRPYNTMNADVNGDGDINLKDALNIQRCKAGLAFEGSIGEWIFESEQ